MTAEHLLHVVTFTLDDDVARSDPRALAAARVTAEHPRHIPEIRTWECGWDVSGRRDAVDFLLVATFASVADYEVFRTHPDHERGKAAWSGISTWKVADLLQGAGTPA